MNYVTHDQTEAMTMADRAPLALNLPLAGVPDGPADGTPVVFGIRPEDVRVVDPDGPVDFPQAPVSADSIEQLGSESYLYCTLPGDRKLTVHHVGQTRVRRDEAVRLAFDTRVAHVFGADRRVLERRDGGH